MAEVTIWTFGEPVLRKLSQGNQAELNLAKVQVRIGYINEGFKI
jgi:hypothetical protein